MGENYTQSTRHCHTIGHTIAVCEGKESWDGIREGLGAAFAALCTMFSAGVTVEFNGLAPLALVPGADPAQPPAPRPLQAHVNFVDRHMTGDMPWNLDMLGLRGLRLAEGDCPVCEATLEDKRLDYKAIKKLRTLLDLHLASHNPEPEVLKEAKLAYPYVCPCCQEEVKEAVDPKAVDDDTDLAHARAHHGSRLGRPPLVPFGIYKADGHTVLEIADILPGEWLHYFLRTIEFIFGVTIGVHVRNKEIQMGLYQFLKKNFIFVHIPIATHNKAKAPLDINVTFNGNSCARLIEPNLYFDLVTQFGGPTPAVKLASLKLWDSAHDLTAHIGAGGELADTPQNWELQAAGWTPRMAKMYSDGAAIAGNDKIAGLNYSHVGALTRTSFGGMASTCCSTATRRSRPSASCARLRSTTTATCSPNGARGRRS